MKIAVIFFGLTAPGGSASVFVSVAKALQDLGHTVDVYTYYFDKKNCFPDITKHLNIYCVKEVKEEDYNLNNNSIFNRFQIGIDYYLNARKIYDIMKDKKYDVIFASEANAYIPGLKYKATYNVPLVWSVFDPLSLVDNKRAGLIIHKHKWFAYILKVHNIFDTKNLRKLDTLIVPTKKMKGQLDAFYKVNCTVLPTAGIRVNEYRANNSDLISKRLKEKFSFVKKDEIILFSNGHFLPHRRYEDNLYAVRKLVDKGKKIKYIISGSAKFDPIYFQKIQDLTRELGLEEYVILDGEFKTNKEIIGYYQYSDIFLFVSIEQTWGLAPFEAMACKKPVIISRGVGCSEVLENGVNAFIVNERAPEEIASSVLTLLKDKERAKAIAQKGYTNTLKHFDYGRIAEKLVNEFEKYINP